MRFARRFLGAALRIQPPENEMRGSNSSESLGTSYPAFASRYAQSYRCLARDWPAIGSREGNPQGR
jgi:hypothetical protein